MTIEATTLETLKWWTKSGRQFCVFTCYDATTAQWLALGGANVLLVGDSAGRVIPGLRAPERPSIDFMTALGAAVGRGAPGAFVMVDYPDQITDATLDHGKRIRQLFHDTGASAIKVEGDAKGLRGVLSDPATRSVPIVAHLRAEGVTPDCCSSSGPNVNATTSVPESLVGEALSVARSGAAGILLEGVAPTVSAEVVCALRVEYEDLPVFGCNSGPSCHGQVEMLHRLLGLNANPLPATPQLGQVVADTARQRIDALAASWGDCAGR